MLPIDYKECNDNLRLGGFATLLIAFDFVAFARKDGLHASAEGFYYVTIRAQEERGSERVRRVGLDSLQSALHCWQRASAGPGQTSTPMSLKLNGKRTQTRDPKVVLVFPHSSSNQFNQAV